MSVETERLLNSDPDMRKDAVGGDRAPFKGIYKTDLVIDTGNTTSSGATTIVSTGKTTTENYGEYNSHINYLKKSPEFSVMSRHDDRKSSLQRSNSDSSYSSLEADFPMTPKGGYDDIKTFPNDELISVAAANSQELKTAQCAAENMISEVRSVRNPKITPHDTVKIDGEVSVESSDILVSPDEAHRQACFRETHLPAGMLSMRKYKSDRHLPSSGLQNHGERVKNMDGISGYFFSKKHKEGSADSLVFISDSGENQRNEDLESECKRNETQSDFLQVISKRWHISSSSANLRDHSKVLSGSDQLTLTDPTEFHSAYGAGVTLAAENGFASENGVELAKEILGHTSDPSVSTPIKRPSPKATNDIALNGSFNKSGKSSSDKKKRGLSWYSVLSPNYKSRSDDFKRIFKDIPHDERLIVDYSCALQKDILVQGRLYVSQSWICFYANIFRWETVLMIRCKDVIKLTKERTARVIPNAIQICTKDDKYFFTSFGTRDKTFLMLDRVWKYGLTDEVMSRKELWQWIHYGYGEELGLTSGDEDYVTLSTEEKINFQTQVQREERKLQKLSQRSDASGNMADKDPSEDYINVMGINGELPSQLDDIDSSLADNLSVASADDSIFAFSDKTNVIKGQGDLHVNATDAVTAAGRGDLSTDVGEEEDDDDVSTEDEEVDDSRCSDHSHFAIDVVDEVFNIPIDALFEHCFNDSILYREFVKKKKTFDVVLSQWPNEADATGVKVRNIAYTLSLNYSIGPKYSPSTERQIMHPETCPGQFYLIDTECINGGIPYGENFYIVNRYCISKISTTKSRLRITSELRYRKSVWGFVRNFIDKNATAGIIESFNVLADLLRHESDKLDELSVGQLSTAAALGRRKVLRRRRMIDRSMVKLPSSDVQHTCVSKQSTPVKHMTPKAVAAKTKEDFHVKLTIDILVRIVCAVLILLLVFNAVLFYKLWSLETTASHVLLTHRSSSQRDSNAVHPESKWTKLNSEQQVLHDTEMERWREILSTSIQLMDEMIQTLSDLKSNIERRAMMGQNVEKKNNCDKESECAKV